jgi:hypothetical protein
MENPISISEVKEVFQEMIDLGISVKLVEYNGKPELYKGKILGILNDDSEYQDKLVPLRYYQVVCSADAGNYPELLSLLDAESNTGSSFSPTNRIFKKLSALGMEIRKFEFLDKEIAIVEFRYFR